jgi:hypothetical protein
MSWEDNDELEVKILQEAVIFYKKLLLKNSSDKAKETTEHLSIAENSVEIRNCYHRNTEREPYGRSITQFEASPSLMTQRFSGSH